MVPLNVGHERLNPPGTLRFRFHKVGALQYISHLDLVRTLTKAVVRAGIPVWYTEGFNPKPRLSFATPMSVGLESLCEFLDVRIDRAVDPQAAMEALNRNLTEECCMDEAYFPQSKFTEAAFSDYTFRIQTTGADEALAACCGALLNAEEVVVCKKTKSGEKDVNIRPWIQRLSVSFEEGEIVLHATLSIAGDTFLNPEYLIAYLREKAGILSGSLLSERYSILRTGTFFADGTPFR